MINTSTQKFLCSAGLFLNKNREKEKKSGKCTGREVFIQSFKFMNPSSISYAHLGRI
jgi:hypothetical protein